MDTPSIDFLTNLLAGPTTLTATAGVPAPAVNLAWDDNSINEDGFTVERRVEGGAFSELASVASNVTSFKDTTVMQGTTYSYRVKAFNSTRDSVYSPLATIVVPAPSSGGGGGCGNIGLVSPPLGPMSALRLLSVFALPLLVALLRRQAKKWRRPAFGM